MGVRLVPDGADVRLYCSTSEVYFGPPFADEALAQGFISYVWKVYDTDVRILTTAELMSIHAEWQATRLVGVRAP